MFAMRHATVDLEIRVQIGIFWFSVGPVFFYFSPSAPEFYTQIDETESIHEFQHREPCRKDNFARSREEEGESEDEDGEGRVEQVTLGITSWVRLPIMGPRGITQVPRTVFYFTLFFFSFLSFRFTPVEWLSYQIV